MSRASGKKQTKKSRYLDDMKSISNDLFTYFSIHYEDEKTEAFWEKVIADVTAIVHGYEKSEAYDYAVKYGCELLHELQRLYKKETRS